MPATQTPSPVHREDPASWHNLRDRPYVVKRHELAIARKLTVARAAAAIAAIGFAVTVGYQVCLALGIVSGSAAWGGQYDVLPLELRVASAVAAFVLLLAAVLVLGRAGYWRSGSTRTGIFRWGVWILAGFMALSALSNFASDSPCERFLLGPSALLLALLCTTVGLGTETKPEA